MQMTKIFDIAYEVGGDSVLLEQDMGCGEVHRIELHMIHLRLLAEKTGLVPAVDPDAERTIARLCRQMRLLFERIDTLHDWLVNHSDHKHADLSYELSHSRATWDLANEFCADLPSQAEPATLSKAPDTETVSAMPRQGDLLEGPAR